MEGKVNQIRLYSGDKYELLQEAQAGMVCAVTGLEGHTRDRGSARAGFGTPVLEPVLTYRVELPEGCDVHRMVQNLRQIEEEKSGAHVVWVEEKKEIHIQLMGEVQTSPAENGERPVRRSDHFWKPGILYIKRPSTIQLKGWAISNPCGIMRRCIFFWSRGNAARACSMRRTAARTS